MVTHPLSIHLLGDCRVAAGETLINLHPVPRLQSLLAFLVLHRTTPQSRSQLAFLFWPDSEEAQAHTNLRKLVHQLRQILPQADHFLHVDRHSLRWLPSSAEHPWTLDVEELEEALAQAAQAEQVQDIPTARRAYEQVLRLYRGDLLPSCYDEWILTERDRLRQLFVQAAERMIVLLDQERDYDAAIRVAQQLLRLDPLHEAMYRHLMRFYALRGDRAAALRTYHTCATLLERELTTEPGQATRQVYERLLQANASSPPMLAAAAPRSTGIPLVGRQAEWGQMQAAWSRATNGQPQLVLLSGEAGIGKTRLAEELEAWVRRQGMTTASARCYAAEGPLPYAPVAAWLRAEAVQPHLDTLPAVWLAEIAHLVPELLTRRPDLPRPAPMTEGWQRQQFFVALAHALLSAPQPLLLLLDDLQWCDHETLEWLHYLLRFEPEARFLVIGTMRSEETLPGHPLLAFLSAIQRKGLVTEVVLGPLSTSETALLAQHTTGHPLDAATLSTLYQEAEGNPLFVVELLRSNLLSHPASVLPPLLQTVLTARLAQLSPLAQELAHLAAVIGREFSFAVLAQVSAEEEAVLVRGLDELWQRRLIREQGDDAYDFTHDKLREAAYAALSVPRRRFLHRQVAETMERLFAADLDAVSQQIALHYERAGLSARAITFYQRAGEAASRLYANEEAITNFRHAAALLASSNRGQYALGWQVEAALQERLGDMLEVTGKHDEAAQAYQQALTAAPAEELLWHARLARKYAATRDYPPHLMEALEAYWQAERHLEQAPVRSSKEWQAELIQILLGHLHICFMLTQVPEMTRLIEQIQPLLEQEGTAAQRADFWVHVAWRDALRDHYVVSEATLVVCRRGLEAAQETHSPAVIGPAHFGLGYCLLLAGDVQEAEAELREALRLAEQVGDAELGARCRLHFLPMTLRRRGQVEAVRRTITQALAQGEGRYPEVIAAQRAWLAWREGDLAAAETYGRMAMEAWRKSRRVYPFQWMGLWPLIGVALAREQVSQALDYARLLLAPTQQHLPETLHLALTAALEAGEREQPQAAQPLLRQALAVAQDLAYL
jgi:DNA-binding SARP family transcriptional activator